MDTVEKIIIGILCICGGVLIITTIGSFIVAYESIETTKQIEPSNFRKDVDIYYNPAKKNLKCYNKTDTKLYRDEVPCF